MKKLGIIVLSLFMQTIIAQTNRFVYQVTMKPDASDKNDIKTENAYLDISPEKSVFYSENRIKRDSVIQAAMQSGGARGFNRDQMQSLRSIINYSIEKDKKSQKMIFKDRIGRDVYTYEEDRPISWKIFPETTKIGEYKVQKAETDFGGRKWTAWFTTDLPYQDGPYKFGGLPGLIVKVEDDKDEYSFDLMKNYKIADFPTLNQFGNTIKVKRSDYVKQQKKFMEDPMSFMSQGGGISAPMRVGGGNRGGGGNPAEMRKRMEERVKEEAKKNSNPIELQ
ncbi:MULTISPECIES: GLPGLI family protein [Chryseobacterium]|jgi:GLPGLI family protein|uniref:GLPGLI family protein n=1 Tax=Chryseobacterium nepalense TaxID=1854498 RepID=A0ABY4K100_9FLAO|nr:MULTISPECIES: GLPGLI family protein [Chryseobacterium]MEA1850126.1 GLPGLI family protein [Chryseobacterium sp. MHB01]MEC5172991.1 GLPGLI family protein [Chryseobacterium nepalense]UPQ74478.1 GLPGLI family protein [Chryseobacterium nepalense]